MKLIFTIIFFCISLLSLSAAAQPFAITGKVIDDRNTPVSFAEVTATLRGAPKLKVYANEDGSFSLKAEKPGSYRMMITHPGYDTYLDSFRITDGPVNLGTIHMLPAVHMLDEVKIVEKVLAMVQKDDTMEYNSGAYKVNPDADAADLVRKMPLINLDGKKITAQGESVVKVLVDGKPFFGDDPYASLKNIPAEMIDKVQVYNEKSDQERFTGFSEGQQNKTINVVTKRNKRKGVFGKLTAGGGADNSGQSIYGSSVTLNSFDDDQRITLTGQSNNINIQNFTEQESAGGGGIATTNAAGINYNDKWGKKIDISSSYFFNTSNSATARDLQKTYILATDSGQIYHEYNPSASISYTHTINMRFTYTIDSQNTLLWQPRASWNINHASSSREGGTTENQTPVNSAISQNVSGRTGYNLASNLLLSHRFRKKGRTFSLGANLSDNGNNGNATQQATNIYYQSPSLNSILNQQIRQKQDNGNITADAAYTQPVAASGLLKVDYSIGYQPAQSAKDGRDYSDSTHAYTQPDDVLSNVFNSTNTAHKAGISYLYHGNEWECSAGLNYQYTMLRGEETSPTYFNLTRDFSNLLPVINLQYKISKSRNLQCNYNTATQAPTVNQLQNVINNSDPLHLYTGNPGLQQPYSHSLLVRYNASNTTVKSSFSASVNGRYTQHTITQASIIAQRDTIIGPVVLARGSQLSLPENTESSSSLTVNLSYSQPLDFMKCRINVSTNGGINNTPAIINNVVNRQNNRNGNINISLGSNISENIDFVVSSVTSVTGNANTINAQITTNYINENVRASINLISSRGIVFNTTLSYQGNYGLPPGYNQDYLLWNLSLGKKIFRKRQGDIRLSIYDIFNNNSNIQHIVTETYVQDTRSNILQRYVMLAFNYKINKFRE